MKKQATPRRAAKKGRRAPVNFREYLAIMPLQARDHLVNLHSAVRSALPRGVAETISYGIPAFRNKAGILVWIAGFSSHCSLFPKASVIEKFKRQLRGYKTSKGTVQFPHDKPLPVALIKCIVKARLVEASKAPRT